MPSPSTDFICYYSPNFGLRFEPVFINKDIGKLNFSCDFPFVILFIGNNIQAYSIEKASSYSYPQQLIYNYGVVPGDAVHFLSACNPSDLIQAGTYEFTLN